MSIAFLIDGFKELGSQDALVWKEKSYSYAWLLEKISFWQEQLDSNNVTSSSIVALEGDFSPNTIAALLALIEKKSIVVPLTSSVSEKREEFLETAQADCIISLDSGDNANFENRPQNKKHALLQRLEDLQHPGLILFSSGSTGKSKAAVHDFVPLLEKFQVPRHAYRTISFLLFDHIGGVNTLFYTLSNGGCLVTLSDRSPEAVCQAIEAFKVEILPTSPTFLNLLLLSEVYTQFDLSSLKLITYGTEPMPETSLQRLHSVFPHIRLLQTYGLSELGILRSKSRSSDSLWVKIGGEDFKTRIVNGKLEIKAKSAMLGYLNAPSPFTEDGYFQTGDAVEVEGEYLRILGRTSEIINVGGEKVYPAEVEGILQQMDGVEDAIVKAAPSAITGQMVVAKVKLTTTEDTSLFRKRMREHCKDKLDRFKIPQKITFLESSTYNNRFKKLRS